MTNLTSTALRWLISGLMLIALVAVLAPTVLPSQAQEDPRTPEQWCADAEVTEPETRRYSEPEQVLEEGVDYYAIFCTGNGPVYVDLFEQYAPVTVNSFVFLAQNGFYNNSTFHRVIEDFMAQGGDPVGNPTGTGGPGYQFEDEFVPFLVFDRPGLLAMANAGPATNGSQFFITRVPTPHLNQRHTIFGQVLDGQEVIDTMTNTENGETPETLETVLIITDPSLVVTDYVPPAPATPDEALEAIQTIFENDPSLTSDDAATATTVEEAIARFSGDAQTIAEELYSNNGFVYEAGGLWTLNDCSGDTSLLGVGFRMTNWESNDAALNVLNSDLFAELMAEQGFEFVEDNSSVLTLSGFDSEQVYSRSFSDICDASATYVRYVFPAERFTIELDIIINDSVFDGGQLRQEDIPAVVADVVYQITPAVASIILHSNN